jgi:hypothetical protein
VDVTTETEPVKEELVGASEAEWILRAPFQVQADLFGKWPENGGIPQLKRNLVQ